jgi:1-phosphatidylinositol-3-phosphate 5-kinase
MDLMLPPLLAKLAEREKASTRNGRRRPKLLLTGDERTALDDLRGWREDDPFPFDEAFAGFQQLATLYSEHVPAAPRILEHEDTPTYIRCGPQRWVTHRFWSAASQGDIPGDDTLGGTIERVFDLANEPCELCDVSRKLHAGTWNHDTVKVTLTVTDTIGKPTAEMRMWESCAVCAAQNPPMPMNDSI